MPDIRHPTPDEMVAHLVEAARESRWNHWTKDFHKHRGDWRKLIGRSLTDREYADLPLALAQHQHVELCTYTYRQPGHREGIVAWGFFRKHFDFQRIRLIDVGVVYDPTAREIVHCMRFKRGKGYCEQYFKDGLAVRIRW